MIRTGATGTKPHGLPLAQQRVMYIFKNYFFLIFIHPITRVINLNPNPNP